MESKHKKLLAGGLLLTGLFSIGLYLKRQYDFLYNATYKISSAVIHNVSLSNIKFTIYIKLTNKGDLSAWIRSQSYDIFVNDVFVVNVKNLTDVHVNSNGDSVLPLTIEFDPSKLASTAVKNIASLLLDRSKIIFKIKGTLTVEMGAIKIKDVVFNMLYTLQEIIDISKTPTIEPESSFSGNDKNHEACLMNSVGDVPVPNGIYRGILQVQNVKMKDKSVTSGIITEKYPIRFKTDTAIKTLVPVHVLVKVKNRRACVHTINNSNTNGNKY
jgi:LEA14-like dessication related protein